MQYKHNFQLNQSFLQNFAVEQLITDKAEIKESALRAAVEKAGGANYGTGVRG